MRKYLWLVHMQLQFAEGFVQSAGTRLNFAARTDSFYTVTPSLPGNGFML